MFISHIISSVFKGLFKSFTFFHIEQSVFSLLICWSGLYILDMTHWQVYGLRITSTIFVLYFYSLNGIFW